MFSVEVYSILLTVKISNVFTGFIRLSAEYTYPTNAGQ